jgi:hypothetical protein
MVFSGCLGRYVGGSGALAAPMCFSKKVDWHGSLVPRAKAGCWRSDFGAH